MDIALELDDSWLADWYSGFKGYEEVKEGEDSSQLESEKYPHGRGPASRLVQSLRASDFDWLFNLRIIDYGIERCRGEHDLGRTDGIDRAVFYGSDRRFVEVQRGDEGWDTKSDRALLFVRDVNQDASSC